MVASGTFGYDGYGSGLTSEMELSRLGAVIPKTVTREPREGNPEPRWDPPSYRQAWEQGDYIFLNSIGLTNPGIEAALTQLALQWEGYATKVLLSISGHSVAQFGEMAAMTRGVAGFQGIELNLSCPNIENGALFSHSASLTAAAVGAVRANTGLPLLAKLAPNVPDVTEIAKAAVDAGADALTISNTVPAMAIDVGSPQAGPWRYYRRSFRYRLRPISLALVYRAAQVVDVPIVGVGGIFEAKHVLEYILAGATAVQIGSANLVGLWSPFRIVDELRDYLETSGVSRLAELTGGAQGR